MSIRIIIAGIVRPIACTIFVATSVATASAQYSTQTQSSGMSGSQASPPATTSQQVQNSPLSSSGNVPAGYFPTTRRPWPFSDRIALSGTRPLPPGYRPTPEGVIFDPPWNGGGWIGHPYCGDRSYGPLTKYWATCCQEKQSFCMYIRGYGPAIHTRPASICW